MREIVSKLRRKLRPHDTDERCGLILQDGQVFQVTNIHPYPDKGFEISAEDMHEHEASLFGTWHTHPGQSSNLSQEDYRGFSQWPHLTHFIIGNDGVRGFRFDDELLVEVEL